MRILGAVLAGGRSSRFGSDKARALHGGIPLIDHVIAALAPQVEDIVICGGEWPGQTSVADMPATGLGPLGGLCGALLHAAHHGHDAVLCAPCDTLALPSDLAARLGPGPAVALGQRGIGLWPASLGTALLTRLASGGGRSVGSWVAACGAREIDCGVMRNINCPGDIS